MNRGFEALKPPGANQRAGPAGERISEFRRRFTAARMSAAIFAPPFWKQNPDALYSKIELIQRGNFNKSPSFIRRGFLFVLTFSKGRLKDASRLIHQNTSERDKQRENIISR